jgi:hypothetical protein
MNSAFRLQPHQCKLLIYMDRMTCTLKSPAENRDRNGLFGYEKWRRGRLAAQEEIAPNRANTGGTSKKIPTDKSRDFYEWWWNSELNPRPQSEPDGNALALRTSLRMIGRIRNAPFSITRRQVAFELPTLNTVTRLLAESAPAAASGF